MARRGSRALTSTLQVNPKDRAGMEAALWVNPTARRDIVVSGLTPLELMGVGELTRAPR